MAIENYRAPALPLAPVEYDSAYMAQLLGSLRLYFNQLDGEVANKAYSYRAQHFYGGDLAVDYIDFNTTMLANSIPGRLKWNPSDETLDLGLPHDVTLQIGQEMYARVANSTGSTIPNGSVVGFSGVGPNQILEVSPYLANGGTPALYLLGVMTHELVDSGTAGYCTVFGAVHDIDTTGTPVGETWAVGDVLYASPTIAGALTKVKPTAPNNCIPVAAVLNVGATDGHIFVRPTIEQTKYYGVFSKTGTQSPAAINTEYLLTFNTTAISNGVTIGTPASRIVVPQSGLYQFDSTIQLTSSSSSQKNVWFWLKKNGSAIPNTSRIITSNINSGYAPLAFGENVSLAAGDYVEIAFAADSTAVSVSTVAATAFAPAAPAAVLTVTQVQL